MTWLWKSLVAMGSAAIVVVLVWRDMQHNQAGEISAVHAQVAELHGGKSCDACHGDEETTMKEACLECHEALFRQLQAATGLHAQLSSELLAECGKCHLEHVGSDYELAGERSFRLSGFPGPDGFEHGYGDFDLHGKHEPLACKQCHPNSDKQTLAAGEQRYMGQAQACQTCHDDPHKGVMKRACEACHGQMHAFTELTSFQHHQRFPLHASHAGLECADCHEQNSAHSVEALSGEVDFSVWRSCSQCHESPHRLEFTAGASCEDCHSEEHKSFAGNEATVTVEQHAATGFVLQNPHQQLACEKCHGDELGSDFAARFPGRDADRCRQCHQDPHQGQFDHEPYLECGCLSCHQQDRFLPHHFDVEQHQLTSYPLTHSHRQIECISCHADGHYAGTSNQCHHCHADVHQFAFASSCAECHRPSQFRDLVAPFEHDRWTEFPLLGAHLTSDCKSCHARTVADANGRTFGRASNMHDGDPGACGGCHADIHRGIFQQAHTPAEYRGNRGCARCHNQHTFTAEDALKSKFDHRLWTGFDLIGAHKQATCLSCHGDGNKEEPPRRLGTLQHKYNGQPQLCRSCHSDPHDGLFDAELGRQAVQGCAHCHNNLSFRQIDPPFDHAKWTAYALEGEHAKVSCVQCHPHLKRADEVGRTTARAAGTTCNQCHVDVHVGQFAEAGATQCQSCHSVHQPGFLIPDFDHQTQTEYPLDPTHGKVECSQCHPRWQLQSGGSAVRYRGTPTQCQDCHQVVPDSGGGR